MSWKYLISLGKPELQRLHNVLRTTFAGWYCSPLRLEYRVSVLLGKRKPDKKRQEKYFNYFKKPK